MTDIPVDPQAEGDAVASPIGEDPIYSASDLVELYSKAYVGEIFRNHLPYDIDGFKTIYRRYLYALKLAGLTNTTMKSARAVAELQDAHPYNDTSMYEIIMRLAQEWNFKPPLVSSPSNIGTYSGNDQAAARYTSSGLTQYTRDLVFEGIDIDAIPKITGASLDVEPKFFIPAIPSALLISNLTIGYGKGCLTARLNLGNVCDLVGLYAEHQKSRPTGRFPAEHFAEKFLPDFPTPCIVTNWKELLEAYQDRLYNTPINMTGRVVITRDKIVVQSLPHNVPFITAINELQDYLRLNKNSKLDRQVKNVVAPRSKKLLGNLIITPRQNVSTLSLWKEIAPIIKFSGRFHPNPNYRIDEQLVTQVDYPNVLARWYRERHMLVMSTKRRRLQALTRQLWIAQAHMVVVINPDRCIEIIRNMKSEDEALQLFRAEFGLTPFQGRVLMDQNLRVLAKISEQRLRERIEVLQKQIDTLMASFETIGDEIAATALTMRKKYEKGRTTHLPDYIGFVRFEHGLVLYETADEVSEILEAFPKEPVSIHPLPHDNVVVVSEAGKVLPSDLHKYMYGSIYSLPSKPMSPGLYTVRIADGTMCYSEHAAIPKEPTPGVFYVGNQVIGLHRQGKLSYFPITDLSRRSNALTRSGARTDITHVLTNNGKPFFIAQMNPLEPNVLVIQRVRPGQASYVTPPMGDVTTWITEDPMNWVFELDQASLSRMNVRAVHISNVDAIVPEGIDLLRYELNAKNKRVVGIGLIP